ncbi:MAG: ABC transporter permease [Bacteroidetes bacterium]|nr:ABC transporter permease [Bacteroidota bacterium]
MLKFLIEKECKQIFRHSFIPKLLVIFPLMAMLVFPWAATMEIKHINIHIVDLDHTSLSRRLIHKIEASTYFNLTGLSASNSQAMKGIESGKADIILEIRPDLTMMISSNAVNGVKGGLGASYLAGILQEYAQEIGNEQAPVFAPASLPIVKVIEQYRYNPHLNYQIFMIPAIMVMLLTLICGFLPALNIVGEKEVGTIEQMNVTPVSRFAFIIAKLIPYWIVGILIFTLCFIVAAWVYGLTPAGSFLTIYFFAAIYILVVSGIGLIISNHSTTLQQAMFVMFFCLVVMLLISGLFTPISSMPEWAQAITLINPLKYFIQVMRAIYLKGSGIIDLLPPLGTLLGFAFFTNIWAVLSYRKTA